MKSSDLIWSENAFTGPSNVRFAASNIRRSAVGMLDLHTRSPLRAPSASVGRAASSAWSKSYQSAFPLSSGNWSAPLTRPRFFKVPRVGLLEGDLVATLNG